MTCPGVNSPGRLAALNALHLQAVGRIVGSLVFFSIYLFFLLCHVEYLIFIQVFIGASEHLTLHSCTEKFIFDVITASCPGSELLHPATMTLA